MTRFFAAALVSAAAATTLAVAPALAAPAPPIDFGSLNDYAPQGPQAPQGNPGKPNARNGVASITLEVTKRFGNKLGPDLYNTGFTPWVKWSARSRSNTEVKGSDCQIEIAFPGTTKSTYKTANCQGQLGVGDKVWKKPGRYSITVVDRVSGSRASKAFTIQ